MKNTTKSIRPCLPGSLKYAIAALCVVCMFRFPVAAQNLIPNPSFELRDSCPTGWHMGFPWISEGPLFAQDWYTPNAGSSDYFNACSPLVPPPGNLPVSAPVNMQGYQQPRTGQAYAGCLVTSLGHEYVESPLLSPTVANHRYFISYWMSLADNSAGACDLFGAYASADSLELLSDTYLDMFTPQVESPPGAIIMDSIGWTQVAGTYISPGGERWLTIGNFHTQAEQDTIQFNENAGFGYGPMYYLFDDVCMLDIDGTPGDFATTDTTLCGNPTLTLRGREDMHNFFWSDNSVGPSLDIADPGTYWVKSINVNTCTFAIDTFRITGGSSVPLEIGRDTTICSNQTVTLKPSNTNFDRFQWSTGSTASSIEVSIPGTYVVTAFSECATGSDTIKIDLGSNCSCLFVPNAFSPNSDGLNDKLQVGSRCPLGFFLLNIYNRFGERIFSSNDPSLGWDGWYKGAVCDQGTYFYNIHYGGDYSTSSQIRELKGDVVLLR